jgi:hypothetical protein
MPKQRKTQNIKKRKHSFSEEEEKYIKQNYLSIPIKRLAKNISRSYNGVMGCLKRMGLIIPKEVVERNIQSSRIKPGNIPVKNGVNIAHFRTPAGIEKGKKYWFKKGNIPHNTKPSDGAISIRITKGRPYKVIRLSIGKWVHLHRHLWEQKNGPIPPGHCLWAKDGDSLNTDPANWEAITRRENRIRNSGSISLSDKAVTRYLSPRDAELREEISTNYPQLIEIKRNQILLERQIKNNI